jgi:hypothetical protein
MLESKKRARKQDNNLKEQASEQTGTFLPLPGLPSDRSGPELGWFERCE